jgi:hypothetical protein
MTTVEQGVEMLEAFDYLAKRDSIRACISKKANYGGSLGCQALA